MILRYTSVSGDVGERKLVEHIVRDVPEHSVPELGSEIGVPSRGHATITVFTLMEVLPDEPTGNETTAVLEGPDGETKTMPGGTLKVGDIVPDAGEKPFKCIAILPQPYEGYTGRGNTGVVAIDYACTDWALPRRELEIRDSRGRLLRPGVDPKTGVDNHPITKHYKHVDANGFCRHPDRKSIREVLASDGAKKAGFHYAR